MRHENGPETGTAEHVPERGKCSRDEARDAFNIAAISH